jgi:hypothetical protein
MKETFNIGQTIFVGGDVEKTKVIKDFEHFGDMILYYMDDMTAYPDKLVFYNANMWFYNKLSKTTVEERDDMFSSLVNGIIDDIKMNRKER